MIIISKCVPRALSAGRHSAVSGSQIVPSPGRNQNLSAASKPKEVASNAEKRTVLQYVREQDTNSDKKKCVGVDNGSRGGKKRGVKGRIGLEFAARW